MKLKCVMCMNLSNRGFRDAITVYSGSALCQEHLVDILKQLARKKEDNGEKK